MKPVEAISDAFSGHRAALLDVPSVTLQLSQVQLPDYLLFRHRFRQVLFVREYEEHCLREVLALGANHTSLASKL